MPLTRTLLFYHISYVQQVNEKNERSSKIFNPWELCLNRSVVYYLIQVWIFLSDWEFIIRENKHWPKSSRGKYVHFSIRKSQSWRKNKWKEEFSMNHETRCISRAPVIQCAKIPRNYSFHLNGRLFFFCPNYFFIRVIKEYEGKEI